PGWLVLNAVRQRMSARIGRGGSETVERACEHRCRRVPGYRGRDASIAVCGDDDRERGECTRLYAIAHADHDVGKRTGVRGGPGQLPRRDVETRPRRPVLYGE